MPLWPGGTRFTRALSTGLGAPPTLLDAAAAVTSHSYADAPVARRGRPFPVVLFSHGYGQGFESQNSAQMEELASHGYVVASIDHPYETAAVVYPNDGPILRGNAAQIRTLSGELDSTTFVLVRRAAAATDSAERVAAVRGILARTPAGQAGVARWTADTRFVLDQLARLNASANTPPNTARRTRDARAITRKASRVAAWPLAGALDLTKVGVMGMSFGGAVAGDVCATDPRCTAGVNLDGVQYGAVLDRPIARPMLFAASDQPGVTGVNDFAYLSARAPAYRLVVRGSHHLNYTDFSLLAPVVQVPGVLGTVDPARMEAIMNAYLVAFFDRHLKGAAAPLLDQRPSPFPEVDLRSRAPGATAR
jgi:predicted dienelactone hydrolase